jgi:dipeptidyl aminopeptidase/acylaminoacyl peptidase
MPARPSDLPKVLAAAFVLQGCSSPISVPPPDAATEPPARAAAPVGVRTAPFGAWESPVGAELLAATSIGMTDLQVFDGRAYWRETRPQEGGRNVIVTRDAGGPAIELTDPRYNARSRVHEYGGASFLLTGDVLIFSNFADQRIYAQHPGAEPVPLTPPGYQYADCRKHLLAAELICVREDHTPGTRKANGEERNEIVAIELPSSWGPGAAPDGTPGRVLVTGSDFVAYPRISPDGRQLAWLSWDHPEMPWDTARLYVADLDELASAGPGAAILLGGGPDEAALEPQWDADGSLYFINDPDGWWNLYRWQDHRVEAIAPMRREFGGPLWLHGASTYALTGDGRAVVRTSLAAVDALGVLDLATGKLQVLDLPYVSFSWIRLLDASTAVAIANPGHDEGAVIKIDLAAGSHEVLHRPVASGVPADFVPAAEAIEFPTAPGLDGASRTAHAFFYPPTHPGFRGPGGEKPPLLVLIHGGPTSVARPVYSVARMYWTSRGFAVVDVNYGGSTTFGREYRQRLTGQWGVVDVQDAVAAVDYLAATGRVDGDRVAIRGGSAGGFTALSALAFTDRFKAGANYFGVSDIQSLAADSHKFERSYDVSLIGPMDEALYRSRSPLYHLEGFSAPLITFQGAEDRVVPPSQSRMIVTALRERGIPTAYIEFEGEQHGLRRAENITRAAEAELYFYGRVFGFTPAGELKPVELVPELPASFP